MSTTPISPNHKPDPGSPYCSDPDCVYCQELRQAEEELAKLSREKEKSA